MPEPIVTNNQVAQPQQADIQPTQQVDNNAPKDINPPKPTPDLITRVSQFKKTDTKPNQSQQSIDDVQFDFKELDNIRTPEEAKTYAEKAYKSMQSGWNKKFQEVAELRKTLESQQKQNSAWTPDRVQSLINDPEFIKAANSVVQVNNPQGSGLTDDQWSTLSDVEKAKISSMEQKLNILEQQNHQAFKSQQDGQLKDKYADYDPLVVDKLTEDLVTGRVQATREHLWRVINYEKDIQRAYELGKQDASGDKQEKLQSASFDNNISAVRAAGEIKKEPGERDESFFKRLTLNNILKSREASLRK